MLRSYEILINKHPNETSFVIGAGTSLFDIMQHEYFKKIFDHVVVSINSSILAMPWDIGDNKNRYFLSNDSVVTFWSYFQNVLKSKSIKIIRNSWPEVYKHMKDFLYFWPRPTPEDIINPEDRGLVYCSSALSGIDLSVQMGIKKIFLLGVDHYDIDGKTHFWEYFSKNKQPRGPKSPIKQQESVFEFNNLAFNALKGFANFRNVKIFNCNMKSKVDVFEKIDFNDVLKK
jgi:hypothetical protein